MSSVLAPLVLGSLFGWALHKAGLTHYARIVNVYRLRDMTVMRFMLTALLVGAIGVQAGVDLRLTTAALPVPPTWLVANVVGGAVFGVGMASAGYCPGTIVAEAGEGRFDALFGGLAGLLVGALVFGELQPFIMPALTGPGSLGRITFPGFFGASPGSSSSSSPSWYCSWKSGYASALVEHASDRLNMAPLLLGPRHARDDSLDRLG